MALCGRRMFTFRFVRFCKHGLPQHASGAAQHFACNGTDRVATSTDGWIPPAADLERHGHLIAALQPACGGRLVMSDPHGKLGSSTSCN